MIDDTGNIILSFANMAKMCVTLSIAFFAYSNLYLKKEVNWLLSLQNQVILRQQKYLFVSVKMNSYFYTVAYIKN